MTYDVPSRAAYAAVLDDALRDPRLADEQREGVDKLLYHMIFEHLVPFDRESLAVTPEAADVLVSRGAFGGLSLAAQRSM